MYFVVDVKVKDDLTDWDVLIELKQNVQCLKWNNDTLLVMR